MVLLPFYLPMSGAHSQTLLSWLECATLQATTFHLLESTTSIFLSPASILRTFFKPGQCSPIRQVQMYMSCSISHLGSSIIRRQAHSGGNTVRPRIRTGLALQAAAPAHAVQRRHLPLQASQAAAGHTPLPQP